MASPYEKDHLSISLAARAPSDEHETDDVVSASVPQKYVGTKTDRQDMMTLGKKQVLRVRTADIFSSVELSLADRDLFSAISSSLQ